MIPRLLIDAWGIQYPKPTELFEKFVWGLCIVSGYGVGDKKIKADDLKARAGLQRARDEKFRLMG